MQTEPGGANEIVKIDLQLKMLQLWKQIAALPLSENPLLSDQYGTMYANIETDQEGLGGLGLAAGFFEMLQSEWDGKVDYRQFVVAHELLQLAAICAEERCDVDVICEILAAGSRIFFVNEEGLPEYVSQHMGGLATWKSIPFWSTYFEHSLGGFPEGTMLSVTMIAHLILADVATKMSDLDLAEDEAWKIIFELGQEHGVKQKRIQKLWGTVGLIFDRRAEKKKTRFESLLVEVEYASNEEAAAAAAAAAGVGTGAAGGADGEGGVSAAYALKSPTSPNLGTMSALSPRTLFLPLER